MYLYIKTTYKNNNKSMIWAGFFNYSLNPYKGVLDDCNYHAECIIKYAFNSKMFSIFFKCKLNPWRNQKFTEWKATQQ